MERMLVIVFNDEAKAYEGSHALKQLDDEGKHRDSCRSGH